MGWTDEQLNAIQAKGSAIVSAAAGSGKTAVLTERIARLIAEGTDIDRFLVVTFTRAAAAEMKKRIGDKLREMARAEGEDPRLMAAAADIGRADISTIDGFCTRVLRRHFQGVGLDPAFAAASEPEAQALMAEAMEELIEESLGDEDFDRLMNAFDGEQGFSDAAYRLYDFLSAQPDPLEWLRQAAEMSFADQDLDSTPMMEEYLNKAKAQVRRCYEELKIWRDRLNDFYLENPQIDIKKRKTDILDAELVGAEQVLSQTTYAGYAVCLNAIEFKTLTIKEVDEELKERVKAARDALKKVIKAQRENDFIKPLSEHAQRLKELRPLTMAMLAFMEKYFDLYAEKKRAEGLIDYGDMEHMALTLLRDPAVAKEYKDRFEYVFVDEYQDCNPVQNEIFAAVSREDNQFYVGDVKQSIYRFRMAEPKLFTDKFDQFAPSGGALQLSRNFRSATAVIDYVNALFSRIMTRETGGVDYTGSARLTAGREERGGAELHILPRALTPEYLEDEAEEELELLAAEEAEALFAAGRIRELVSSTFTDRDGTERNYRYSDIVILHSAPAKIAEVWVRTLSREGVPAYAEMSGGYFEAIEVQVFLNLLRIIDNPLQDIPLISVLRSPIGGFDTEELILLRADNPADSFYGSLAAAAKEALFAAGRIRELVNSTFTDRDGTERNYRYNDIVVLHSSPASIAEVWVRTLSREGVPAYAEMSGGYFEAIEVQVFLNLLRIIDNPLQDIPLISVLRSPIGGFDTEELILLRTDNPAEGFYASLCLGAQKDTLLGAKAKAFLSRLNKWRADAPLYDLGDFMAELMDSTGFEDYVSALPGGPSRRANLEALLENAAAYSRRGQGIGGFIRFMDRAKGSGKMGAARIASANVVRILSIHKSKGLEFPVVFLAGLSKNFNTADKTAAFAMNRDIGLGIKPIRGNLKTSNLMHSAVTARLWRHQVAEQMRVLYVALTRASDRLIMIASLRDMDDMAKFPEAITPSAISAAKCYSDWILPTALLSPGENPLRQALGMADLPGTPELSIYLHDGVNTEGIGSSLPYEQYKAFREQAVQKGPGVFAGRFAWQYPYRAETSLPSKVSVSDLAGNYQEIAEYPAFMRDKAALRPTGRGTAAHTLMEHIPIASHTAESIRAEVARLVTEGILSPAEAEVVSVKNVAAFFASPLGRRMAASPRVERELPFNHRVSARQLMAADTDETILLQGIIDCCFMEEGQWVLIDYKTDFVPTGKAKEAAAKHRRQLSLYRNALEALTGAKVKEMYIHFLGIGESVRVE